MTNIPAIDFEVDKHDNPWLQIEQFQMEIERLKAQNKRFQAQILAERERCAKIAEVESDTFSSNEDASFRDGAYLTARHIMKTIRNQKP